MISRRAWLACAVAPSLAGPAFAAAPTGWARPRLPLPAFELQGAQGRALPLTTWAQGKVCALQLMFAGCSTSCPPQGALFAALADSSRDLPVQLLSISIDALGDTPARLAAWQARFGHWPAWQTGLPRPGDVEPLAAFLRGGAARAGTHTSQVFVLDRQGRLAWRSGELPAVADMVALLRHVSREG